MRFLLIPIPNHCSSNLPSFPRRRESKFARRKLDSRLRGNDGAIIDLLLWKSNKSQFYAEKKKVGFVIEDSFTRHWVQDALKKNGLFFDNSFNTEIVRVDFEQFCRALAFMYDKS